MKIALLRHSITEGNLAGQYVGRIDHPLCEQGLVLARERQAAMPAVERVFCSPMTRARQTAALLFPGHEAIVIDDLRECDFGDWEGKSYNELSSDPTFQRWMTSGGIFSAPGGEQPEAFLTRCKQALLGILTRCEADGIQSASVVLHGGSMMAILFQLAEPERDFYAWQPKNCCGYLLETQPGRERLALVEPLE